jgi:hypothetical protein
MAILSGSKNEHHRVGTVCGDGSTVFCPGCGTSRAIDLRTLDRHPLASVGTLVLGLRCSGRRYDPRRDSSSGEYAKRKHERSDNQLGRLAEFRLGVIVGWRRSFDHGAPR